MVAKRKSAKVQVAKKANVPKPDIIPHRATLNRRPLPVSTDFKKLLAEIDPFLKALDNPSSVAYKQAAATIARLVYDEVEALGSGLAIKQLVILMVWGRSYSSDHPH